MKIPQSGFIYIDIFIVVILLIFLVVGYKRGFVFELVSLVYSICAILVSWFVAPVLASLYPLFKLDNITEQLELLQRFVDFETFINIFIYFVIVFLVLKAFYVVLAIVLKGMNKIPVIGGMNQMLGAIIGIINGLIVTFVLSLVLTLPIFENGNEVKNNTLFSYIDKYSTKAIEFIVDNSDLNHIKDQFTNFDIDNARQDLKDWLNEHRND